MKKRTITIAISLLACIALLGVGFASWIITNDAGDEANGNVQVDTVTNDSIELLNASATDVVFGPISGQGGWLSTAGTKTEQLTTTVTVKVSKADYYVNGTDGDTKLKGLKVKLAVVDKASDGFAAALAAGYVAAAPYTSETMFTFNASLAEGKFTAVEDSEDSNKMTLTFQIAFAWGTKFNGTNPSAFYNTKTATDTSDEASLTWAQHAEKHLGQLNTYLTGVTFKVTVTPSRTAA